MICFRHVNTPCGTLESPAIGLKLCAQGYIKEAQDLLDIKVQADAKAHNDYTAVQNVASRWQAVADLELAGAQAQLALRTKKWDIAEEAASFATSISEGMTPVECSRAQAPW